MMKLPLLGMVAVAALCAAGDGGHRMWYRKPAADSAAGWERESLPLGCGWFGANVFGGVTNERIQVTHNAVLSSWARDGRPTLTDGLEIRIETDHAQFSDYSRGLDLDTAIGWVRYSSGGVSYAREYFTSYPAQTMGMRLSASKAKALSFTIRATAPFLRPFGTKVGKGLKGRTVEYSSAPNSIGAFQRLERYGVLFDSRIRVETDGRCEPAGEGALRITGATAANVYFTCGTNYRLEPASFDDAKRRGSGDPRPRVAATLERAVRKGYDALRKEHVGDVGGLMGRVALDLGADPADGRIPTDELLRAYGKGRASAYLEDLHFQYGRYLLVASSRPGTLPANLQGVWTVHDESPWGCGYWHNINVQMNYWPAFSCNLAECFRAYADYNAAFRPVTRAAACAYLARTISPAAAPKDGEAPDLWSVGTATWPYKAEGAPGGHSGPGTGPLTTKLFTDWWLYTRDRTVLRDYVWPVVHGMADFLERCVVETNGVCLAAFSASPEQFNGRKYHQTVGCGFDQQMIWENNHDLLMLARELGTNDAVVAKARAQIDRYDPVQIGGSGQVKEFREENKYGEIGEYHHRHISHLMGLMPGTLITRNTPEWMKAARVTLTKRGDRSTGWALAHRLCLWARALDGDHAHVLLRNLLTQRTNPNLWDMHPPFQIDGNFGATAGVAEMLLQSHDGAIELLPALPKVWAKKGSFRGLCARGGFEVDCSWEDGRPVSVSVRSKAGQRPDIRFAGEKFTKFTLKGDR